MRPVYKYAAMASAALLFFILSLFVLIPGALVEGIVKGALEEKAGIDFSAKDFRKGFPLGFKAQGVRLSGKGGKGVKGSQGTARTFLVEMDELNVSLALFPLIAGKKKLSYRARLGGGTVEGEATIEEKTEINVKATNVALNTIGPLRALGLESGSVSGQASFSFFPASCAKGLVSLDATGVDVGRLKSPWPALLFGESVSASLKAETTADCKARISGLFIEGRTLNARLNGTVRIKNPLKRSVLDMKVEIFVKPGATEMDALLSLIKKYKKSSGYYSLSLKGTIESPVIKK